MNVRRISWQAAAGEPFRFFFPFAVLAGLTGVLLWPLHFWGMVDFYPGASHVHLMVYGFFGGFIFGFLGTAIPRMLSAPALRPREAAALFVPYAAMTASFAAGRLLLGDVFILIAFAVFILIVAPRFRVRRDNPPPAFLLVAMGLLCGAGGALLSLLAQRGLELDPFWRNMQRLLSSQGFVLFPILGVGGFIMPRFFGMPSRQDFPEALRPSAGWLSKAVAAFAAGMIILASFCLEATGWYRLGYSMRAATILVYLLLDVPFHHALRVRNALAMSLLVAFIAMVAGVGVIAIVPTYRVALLHVVLMGGFAVIAFTVATRVVFGHSGNQTLLRGPNRWIYGVLGLMLLGMATRISGDFWPAIMGSHYSYGAILWSVGALIWSWRVLPKVFLADQE